MSISIKRLKKTRFVRAIFIGFKRFLSVFILPQVLIKSGKIIFQPTTKKKVVVALVEHIGDIVASEPVDRFLKEKNPNSSIFRIVKSRYAEVIRFNPNVDQIIKVGSLSEWIYLRFFLKLFSKIQIVDLHVDQRTCFRHYLTISNPNEKEITVTNYFHFGNLLEVFSLTAGLPKLNTRPIYHLPARLPSLNVPKNYIVVHTLSNGESKMWPAEKWNVLAEILINKGYSLVEIGLQARIKNDSKLFIDMCGRLSFTEIATLIKDCSLFIGIDSSFAHFANALDVKNMLIMLGELYDFGNYNPYSGLTDEKIKDTVIRQDGPLGDLPVDTMIKRVMSKL